MTKNKNEASFKRDVAKVCKHLRWHFFSNGWEFEIIWAINERSKSGRVETVAEIEILQEYLKFRLTLYRMAYDLYLEGKLLPHLVHEFAHLWTEPSFRLAEKNVSAKIADHLCSLNEALTERIARSLIDLPEIKELSKWL